ncbi:MAG: NUDIX hydrolase [Deltaproteobacteria bacterium]|nr:NUDIX hydrolase [Deltaproteobacteria bacterium]
MPAFRAHGRRPDLPAAVFGLLPAALAPVPGTLPRIPGPPSRRRTSVPRTLICPHCGGEVKVYRNPFPTVDVVIELTDQGDPPPIVLIERKNPPLGWALPGGFVDYGESVEQAARREAAEETGLTLELVALLGVYSRPDRDPRQHNLSTVFVGRAAGEPRAGDDAGRVRVVAPAAAPASLCFDHGKILAHYRAWREGRRPAAPADQDLE